MSVASSTSKSGPYAGDGSTTSFSFSFQVQAAANVSVVTTEVVVGVYTDTTLAQGVDYTVTLNVDQTSSPGGSITTTTAPATGVQLTILRDMTATQGAVLTNQGGWYPKVIENALDKLTMLVQQLLEDSTRYLKLSVADSITNLQDFLTAINTAVSNAQAAASAANSSASAAAGSETAAGNSASAAAGSAATAYEWAEKTSGPVAGSEYSAKYWAQQAKASVVGEMIYRGAWDASGGIYPPTPATGDFYKVSVPGTVGSVYYAAGDNIAYNGTDWDHINNSSDTLPLFLQGVI